MRYLIILAVATSWSQFLPFYDMLTNVPSSVGARLLDVSGTVSLNEALDTMVTSIFDFSDRAADESGFFSISLLSIILAIVGALMACVAILVAGIAKVGLAMAVSLAPLFIASLLFRGTSDLFSSWAKFTLGFALIPLVLAGVMGVIVGIGETHDLGDRQCGDNDRRRRLPDRGAGRDLPDEPGADDGERPGRHGRRHGERHPRGAPAGRRRRDGGAA